MIRDEFDDQILNNHLIIISKETTIKIFQQKDLTFEWKYETSRRDCCVRIVCGWLPSDVGWDGSVFIRFNKTRG